VVAIKVLPDAFAGDAERLARFEREAKTLAALNHPNIAAIYGFERSASMQALVMELVQGEDLSQRTGRGPIQLDEGCRSRSRSPRRSKRRTSRASCGAEGRDQRPAAGPDGAVAAGSARVTISTASATRTATAMYCRPAFVYVTGNPVVGPGI
jgi:hypothetical protein